MKKNLLPVFTAVMGCLMALVWVTPLLAQTPDKPAAAPSSSAPAAEQKAEPKAKEKDKTVPASTEKEVEEENSARELSASQAIAEMERRREKKESATSLSHIQNLLSFEYELKAKTEAEAIKEASVRALTGAAARLYFGNYIIIGRDLLDSYLRNYGDRFVARRTVLSRTIQADGSTNMRVRIGVDVDRYYADLQEKHFLAKPQVRPLMAVLLEEVLDGKPTDDGRGRKLLESALTAKELRVDSTKMGPQKLNANVLRTTETLRLALEEAQRGEVEVIVTGSLVVSSKGEHPILYDQFSFYDAQVQLALIRVDNGQILARTRQNFSASGISSAGAQDKTFEGLMTRAVAALADNFLAKWQRTMLDVGDYRLMITDVSQEQLEGVFSMLKTLSPKIEAEVKSFYGDVAIINLFFPEAKPGQVEEFLRNSRVPQFLVRPADERRFELRAL